MKRLLHLACALPIGLSTTFAAGQSSSPDSRLDWWQDARLGMFIHWGLYAIPAGVWGDRSDYGEWIRSSAKIPLAEYETLREKFNPVHFDADAVARAAADAGMKYIVITSKHHDGFCLFDSAETEWDVMSTPFKRDIMKELADACRSHGLKICWYYSIMDWHHPDYTPRRDWEKDRPTENADYDRYVAYMKAQLKELLTNYGEIGVLWFDGQWEHHWSDERGRDLYAYVRGLQPNIIINSRVGRGGGDWGMDRESGMLGDYGTPEQTIPDRVIADIPWETCMTMNGHWGYNAADKNYKSTATLIRNLADITGKGGNFLLNVGPMADGRIPPESLARLAEMGRWMRTHGESIYGTSASPFPSLPWGTATQKPMPGGDTRLYLHVFDWPGERGLVVPGLLNKPRSAHILGEDGLRKASVHRSGVDLVIYGPPDPPNLINSVIVLDLPGKADVGIAPTISAPSRVFIDNIQTTITSPQTNVEIRYTTDGSEPTMNSTHGNSVMLGTSGTLKAAAFRDGERVSPVAAETFEQVVPRKADMIAEESLRPGLRREYFEGEFKSVNDLARTSPAGLSVVAAFDISGNRVPSNFAYRYRGFVRVPITGVYRFHAASDDGSALWIGDTLVVNNDEPHSFRERSGDIALEAGLHPITVSFFENSGGYDLKVYMTKPNGKKAPIDAGAIWHSGKEE